MKRGKKTKKPNHFGVPGWIYWLPRIVSIIFLLFLAMFSLDVFGNGYSFWETVLGLFMHNIPVFVLLILLIIAWKHEWVGAIAFILAGIAYVIMTLRNPFEWYMISWFMIVAVPAITVGILFWINWKLKKKAKKK